MAQTVAAPPLKPRRGVRGVLREMRREWTAYLFNAPWLILFATFTLYAVVVSLWLSFHDWDPLVAERPFIGLDNYREVWSDRTFWAAVGHTVYFTAGSIIPAMAIGLGVALLLNTQLRALGLFRALYYRRPSPRWSSPPSSGSGSTTPTTGWPTTTCCSWA